VGWLTLEQHLERGMAALQERDFEAAGRHFQAAAEDSSDLSIRDQLQDVLKLQYWWILLLRTLGFIAPIESEEGVSRSRYVFYVAIGLITSALIKLARSDPTMEEIAILGLSGLFGVVMTARVLDCTATLLARAKPGGHLAVTGGDVVGAWTGIVLLMNSAAWLIPAAATKNIAWAAIAFISFINARAIQLVFRTPAGAARIALATYLLLVDLAALVGIIMLSRNTVPGDLSQKIPALSGLLVLIPYLLAAAIRPVRSLVLVVFGSGLPMVDASTRASRAGGILLSDVRLRRLHPELYGIRGIFFGLMHGEHGVSARDARSLFRQALLHGDSQPAVVVSVEPLVVAAYSDDLDAVVLLEFDASLSNEFGLTRGHRLVSVNTYFPMQYRHLGEDIQMGPDSTNLWGNVTSHIADFLTEDTEALRQVRQKIRPEEWEKLKKHLSARLKQDIRPRDGRPLYCHLARALLEGA